MDALRVELIMKVLAGQLDLYCVELELQFYKRDLGVYSFTPVFPRVDPSVAPVAAGPTRVHLVALIVIQVLLQLATALILFVVAKEAKWVRGVMRRLP